jgi:hypothetical protein
MIWPNPLIAVLPRLPALLLVLLPLVCCAAPAQAGVSVEGTAAALRVTAEQAPLSEVMDAIERSLGVRHSSLIALDDRAFGGTYSGTLEDVLRRLLVGLSYMITTRDGAIEVVILGRAGAIPSPSMEKAPPLPPNANPATQWRPRRQ